MSKNRTPRNTRPNARMPENKGILPALPCGVRRSEKENTPSENSSRKNRHYIQNLIISQASETRLEDFGQYLKVTGYSDAKTMVAAARELLHQLEKSNKKPEDCTGEDLKKHYEYLLQRPNYRNGGGLSHCTINGYLYGIKMFLSYAEKTGMIPSNPMSVLNFPSTPITQRQVLTKGEIEELYKACIDEQERAIMGLFYGCGLRREEAVTLNLRDVDLREKWLYIRSGKGRKRRVIPLAKSIAEDLGNYRYNQRPMQETRRTRPVDKKAFMLNKIGRRTSGQSYWMYFKNILQRTKISPATSLHHLRHSIATHLLAGGMGIEEVRDFLGHDVLSSTQIYTRVHSDQLKL